MLKTAIAIGAALAAMPAWADATDSATDALDSASFFQLGVVPVHLSAPSVDPVGDVLATVARDHAAEVPPLQIGREPGLLPPAPPALPPPPPSARELDATAVPEAEIFREVLALVEQNYFDPTTPRDQLFLGAAEGLLRRLSLPGSPEANELIDADAYAAMKRALAGGEMVGIGILVDNRRGGGARVAAVMPGSPAARSGLRSGDRIVWVDGAPAVRPDGRPDIARLRGAPGSKVALTIQRGAQALELAVSREALRMSFHSAYSLDGGVGLLRISLFNKETGAAVHAELERLRSVGSKALILDLRGCEGGALDGALDVVRLLLPAGKTVAILKRREAGEERYTTEGPDLFPGPVAVLVDGETKAAAELVAASLRDNDKAILLGQRTYGKGTAESIFELPGGRALKLTTAAYHGPSGRSWHGEGLAPDVVVEPSGVEGTDAQLEAARRILAFRR